MLYIERGINIDPGLQQFLHVLITLGVTGTGSICVGEFVHQCQFGRRASTASRSISGELNAAVLYLLRGIISRPSAMLLSRPAHVSPRRQQQGLRPFFVAGRPPAWRRSCPHQRRNQGRWLVFLASSAASSALMRASNSSGLGRLSAIWFVSPNHILYFIDQESIYFILSNAWLSSKTLTLGSPRIPNWRPSVKRFTSART